VYLPRKRNVIKKKEHLKDTIPDKEIFGFSKEVSKKAERKKKLFSVEMTPVSLPRRQKKNFTESNDNNNQREGGGYFDIIPGIC